MKKILLLAVAVYMMLIATIAFAQETPEVKEAQEIQKSGFHFSFVSPLGTNGKFSHLTINTVSLNLLGGYSYGNTAFEFGGLYNVNTNMTKGFQFAGLSNYSGNGYHAAQFAGITNIVMDGTVSFQFGGVTNIAKDVNGLQFAGVNNIASNVNGLQFAGVSNIASDVNGVQFGGAVNVARDVKGVQFGGAANGARDVSGVQFGGAVNVARDVKGLQFAGAVNVARDVDGVQAGGVVNVARKLKGVQFGLINYADESDGGVSIGLINIIKKGGKQEFEVAFSEALNATVNFRLGTDKFYTIFSGGINYFSTPTVDYAVGLGLGTHIDWAKGWGNQIELMYYVLTEDAKFTKGVNMLTQLKFTVSKEFAKRFKVFAGPVLNLTISDYKNSEGKLGSSVDPWVMWKNDSDRIRLNGWLGFVAGVRF